jgi:hydroxymethylglutaryl-CoA lyase
LTTRLYLNEVATRDGFQNEKQFIPTDEKIALINQLSLCGFAKIEVTSFTSSKAIPMLADADELMAKINRIPSVEYSVLVPNMRGAERAIAAHADEFNLVMSTSSAHNQANLRMTCEQSFAQLAVVIQAVSQLNSDRRPAINISLSTSFGCPIEGEVPESTVFSWCEKFVELGVRGITLCDTTGMAFPSQVTRMASLFIERFKNTELTLHFHNTRGMGLANVLAAVQTGVVRFDASLGGLGGCPYAPGATGNICTEDTAHMLALMNYNTGIDEQRLLAAARCLPAIVGHDVPSQVAKAGHRLDPSHLTTSTQSGDLAL